MPPPPPPSASYNLNLDDLLSSSDEDGDDEGHHSRDPRGMMQAMAQPIHHTTGYLPQTTESTGEDIPWAQALPNDVDNYATVEAASVVALPASVSAADEDISMDGDAVANGVVEGAPAKKKKRKKKKKKKKKSTPKSNDGQCDTIATGTTLTAEPSSESETEEPLSLKNEEMAQESIKPRSATRIAFTTVSVREYARTLGLGTVPADGGFPLGLSNEVVADHHSAATASTPSSPGKKKHNSWSVDDFEARRQVDLRQRYTQLIQDQRKRAFEKEWERKHRIHHHNTRRSKNYGRSRSGSFNENNGRSRSGSFNGNCNNSKNSRSQSSGSMKLDMTTDEKEELERILSQPVDLPEGDIESRPFDYNKKIVPHLKTNGSKSKKSKTEADEEPADVSEEQLLYHNFKGRNPIFMALSESERRKVLIRDDHLLTCKPATVEDDDSPLDPADSAVTQPIQHELEQLRIRRGDQANLGCSCRQLQVPTPGSKDKSSNKKKGSQRRLPERKVREELRKRGLITKENNNMKREEAEVLLADAIGREGCCESNDCPCHRDGIGCQADTCTCWLASHDASASRGSWVEQDAGTMKTRCGNGNGFYVTDHSGIQSYREKYVSSQTCIRIPATTNK